MLDPQTFKVVIENVPLVSIDLCLVCDGQILLGKRTNEPLRDEWFTPGGRIHKNETWQAAILRICGAELGLSGLSVEEFSLMGIWDHFYKNSALDRRLSTHYLNLPHYIAFESKPQIILDNQHDEFKWFDRAEVANDEKFHPYMRSYAIWLLNNMDNIHD